MYIISFMSTNSRQISIQEVQFSTQPLHVVYHPTSSLIKPNTLFLPTPQESPDKVYFPLSHHKSYDKVKHRYNYIESITPCYSPKEYNQSPQGQLLKPPRVSSQSPLTSC